MEGRSFFHAVITFSIIDASTSPCTCERVRTSRHNSHPPLLRVSAHARSILFTIAAAEATFRLKVFRILSRPIVLLPILLSYLARLCMQDRSSRTYCGCRCGCRCVCFSACERACTCVYVCAWAPASAG
eukprot:5139824-Pleurochrysis_carterae.AAC.1